VKPTETRQEIEFDEEDRELKKRPSMMEQMMGQLGEV
jgi:hypothetical protein